MKTLIIIPAFNEEDKICRVIKGIPDVLVDAVCVVNDGSSDRTSQNAKEAGAHVINHAQNRGVGASIRSGIDYARTNAFDVVAVISGDDQHDASELTRVLKPICDEGYDLVQGSRYLEGGKILNKNAFRFIGIKLYSLIFRILLCKKLTDGTNGLRAFRTSIFDDGKIHLWQDWLDRYELEPYLLYKAIKLGYRFKEVPITVRYHEDGSYTKMKPFKGWWSLFRPLVFLAFGFRR